MIAVLLNAEALRKVAPLVVAALMVWALAALTAAVVRTSSDRSRHARFWSPPRPARLLATGRHSSAGRRRTAKRAVRERRRAYAATQSKHATHTAVRTA